ncbi:helix-turn-helix transcriptional regulator [Subtercola endophyticus]|uniref:helix-turn-helix transcriptional regulator n=1 Tax=Subtercola endophyticus TaxID=2895559 RepID=UPI001E3979C0|nr:LuxR C-terminal-related transcriptional regulator [Subtercola endophyticus]UFS60531.1 LuxR C-terminal-related transcriptional regulator [Subtercola endophyticus]
MTSARTIQSTASHLRALLRSGLFRRAETDARTALLRIDELDGAAYKSVRTRLPWVWCAAGEVLWAIGDDRAAVPLLERARRDSASGARLFALGDLACVYAVAGDLSRAEERLDKLETVLGGSRLGAAGFAVRSRQHAARGVIALSRLQLEEAGGLATELAAGRADDDTWAIAARVLRSGQALLSGQPERAISALAETAALAETDAQAGVSPGIPIAPALAAAREGAASAAALAGGELGFVMRHSPSEAVEHRHQHLCRPSFQAIALLAVGRPEVAVRRTDECARGTVSHSSRTRVLLLAVRAAAFQAMGRTESAVACLVRLAPLCAESGAAEVCALPTRHRAALAGLAEQITSLPPFAIGSLVDRPRNGLDEVAESFGDLSAREWEVLRKLGSTSTLAEIGHELFTSRSTIASHCRGIYVKLGVGSRADAVSLAKRSGVFEVLDLA